MNTNKFLIPVWIIALSLVMLTAISIYQVMPAFYRHSSGPIPAMDMPDGIAPQNSLPNLPLTSIAFAEQIHDFGVIPDNKRVYTVFNFTNTGKEPLLIMGAEGSCGCTVPTWPKEPVSPAQSAKIEIAFDPNGKMGEHSKIVTITSNTHPTTTILTIKATIIKGE